MVEPKLQWEEVEVGHKVRVWVQVINVNQCEVELRPLEWLAEIF